MFVLAVSPGAAGRVAIGGFDVVAYQSLPASANGTKGSPEFAYNLTSQDMSNSTGQRMEPTSCMLPAGFEPRRPEHAQHG